MLFCLKCKFLTPYILGEEVAVYCAANLHKFLLDCDGYLDGKIEKSLKDAFMNIDQAVTTDEVKDIFLRNNYF